MTVTRFKAWLRSQGKTTRQWAEENGFPASAVYRVLNGKEGTAMQAFRNTLNDVELAAVITYERNALGNSKGDLIQPAQIKALR